MTFRPLRNCVVIRPDPKPETERGIAVPEVVRSKDKHAATGVVVDCGPGKRSEKTGERLPLTVKPNDHVWYLGFSGEERLIDGVKMRLLPEAHVLAVIE